MIGDPVAIRIRRKYKRPHWRLVAKFAEAQTSFIADAQQGWGCMHHSIKSIKAGDRFGGIAVTASNGPRDNLGAMAMLDVARKGDVLVIATGEDESGAVIGDHWAAVAKQRGVAGVVTDGLVRDADGIERLGPPTFSRGISPNAGYRNGPAEVNGAVSIGGVVVNPGDIVVGDRDGVVVVPGDRAREIAAALDLVIQSESDTEALVEAGERKRFWDPERFKARGIEYVD